MRFFSFSLLIGMGALLGHLYLYRRLIRRLTTDDRRRRLFAAGLTIVTLLLLLRGPIRDIGPRVEQIYEIGAYSWLAFALCMVVALLVGDLVHLSVTAIRSLQARVAPAGPAPLSPAEPSTPPKPPPTEGPATAERDAEIDDPSRRRLLRALPWGVVAGGGIMASYGTYRAFAPPEMTEVVLPLAKLPPTLEGLTVVQLTDVHVGSFIGEAFVDMLVEAVNAAHPDLVVITGDLVDAEVGVIGPVVGRLARLRSRFGTYFVTGNHEYYSGEIPWVRFLDRLGITALRNSRIGIGDGGGRFDLVGVDDWSGGRRRGRQGYDLDRALAGRDPERAAILLAHQPTNFEVAVERGVDVQISGHTHGGQIFPMTSLVGLRYPQHRGLYRHGQGQLYVSRGCGFWGPPSRVGSPPEIVKYVLTTA